MLVLSSPSGAGKTTLSRRLLADDGEIEMSISATTRPKRPGEVDGKDYQFVAAEKFAEMREAGEFLEWARVFDHDYGTPRGPVEDALNSGRDVLFDIDWQGARALKETYGDGNLRNENVRQRPVTIFVLPPSGQALEERLRMRAQDSDDVVRRRMAGASNEIQHWQDYDYVLVNDDVEECLTAIKAIVRAERLRRQRRYGLEGFIKNLLRGLTPGR
ncbi:MAG: guanylate kinase [Pseudomonadota bacterium]|nr:guanylate kinase [Pseudomonadota bacterium]